MPDSNEQGTHEQPISAWLATVLAAAAKGSQPHIPVFVVARFKPDLTDRTRPFDVRKPVRTREEAELVKQLAEKEHPNFVYGIFGPFVNEDPVPPVEQDTVATIVLITKQGDTLTIKGEMYDALFFSYEAVEKFALPLYVQEFGTDYAGRVLHEFNQNPLALMAHLPWSEEVLLMENPTDPTLHGVPALLTPGEDGGVDHQPLPPPPQPSAQA